MTWSVHFSPLSFLQVCLSWPKDTILEAGDSSRHVFANCVCVYIFHVGNRRAVHPAELTQLSLTAYNKLLSILVSDASVYSKIFVFIWCCLAGPRILQLHAGCLITHFLKVIKLRTDHKSFAVQGLNAHMSAVCWPTFYPQEAVLSKSITQLFNTISITSSLQVSRCWRLPDALGAKKQGLNTNRPIQFQGPFAVCYNQEVKRKMVRSFFSCNRC